MKRLISVSFLQKEHRTSPVRSDATISLPSAVFLDQLPLVTSAYETYVDNPSSRGHHTLATRLLPQEQGQPCVLLQNHQTLWKETEPWRHVKLWVTYHDHSEFVEFLLLMRRAMTRTTAPHPCCPAAMLTHAAISFSTYQLVSLAHHVMLWYPTIGSQSESWQLNRDVTASWEKAEL